MASKLVARAMRMRGRREMSLLPGVQERLRPSLTATSRHFSYTRGGQLHSSQVSSSEFSDEAEKEARRKERAEGDREENIRTALLDSALGHVARHGWTKAAVQAAAEELGHPSVVAGVVKGGGAELVLHHVARSNRQLDQWMEAEVARQREAGGRLGVGKFVREAVVRRLAMNGPYIKADRWAEALVLTAAPPHCSQTLQAVQELCDDIWHRAGDTSTDSNWYTKRITLAVVYSATEVFMLQDKSEDFSETWMFLDRRLQDLQAAPSMAQMPGDLAGLFGGLLTTARNMAGVQK